MPSMSMAPRQLPEALHHHGVVNASIIKNLQPPWTVINIETCFRFNKPKKDSGCCHSSCSPFKCFVCWCHYSTTPTNSIQNNYAWLHQRVQSVLLHIQEQAPINISSPGGRWWCLCSRCLINRSWLPQPLRRWILLRSSPWRNHISRRSMGWSKLINPQNSNAGNLVQ